MKLGVSLPVFTADPARPLAVAARAHELGLDGVFSPDHFFPPIFYPPSGPERPALEAFSVLSAVAAREPGLAVGTLVARVTLRAPGDAREARRRPRRDVRRSTRSWPWAPATARPCPNTSATASRSRRSPTASRCWKRPSRRFADLVRRPELSGRLPRAGDAGPLLPPGAPAVWVGGLSDPVMAIAARVADAWNGWGLDVDRVRGPRSNGCAWRPTGVRWKPRGAASPSWAGIELTSIACWLRAPRRAAGRRRVDGHRRRTANLRRRPWRRPARPGSSSCPPGRPTASRSSRRRWRSR